MEGQSKEKSISCTLCSAKFTRKSNLKRHMTNIHDTNPRRHFCPFCNFKSIRNANLKRHLKLLHDADIANYDIKSEPIVDLKPSQPAPYIPPFESTASSQHQHTKTEQIYPATNRSPSGVKQASCGCTNSPSRHSSGLPRRFST